MELMRWLNANLGFCQNSCLRKFAYSSTLSSEHRYLWDSRSEPIFIFACVVELLSIKSLNADYRVSSAFSSCQTNDVRTLLPSR